MSKPYYFEIKNTIALLPTYAEVTKFRRAIKTSKNLTADEKQKLAYCCDARESCLWFDEYVPTPAPAPVAPAPVRGKGGGRLKMWNQ
jgi:hypothetical protein